MTTEVEALPHDLPADEEPRYLRRQKPVEVRRRKFGKRTWSTYRRVLVISAAVLASGWALYVVANFFLDSPRVRLSDTAQIEISGNKYVPRETVLASFTHDLDRSVFRIPLDTRRKQLEDLPWVDRARVARIWPNRIRVELVERVPVAYLRVGSDLSVIDAHGVILDRPAGADFQFPVVSGLTDDMAESERESRVSSYSDLVREVDQIKPGASDHISEVDLSDSDDIRASLAGLNQMGIAGVDDQGPVLIHFGNRDFGSKFKLFMDNISQWRAVAGRVESVDLRFSKQVVVNPESRLTAANAHRH